MFLLGPIVGTSPFHALRLCAGRSSLLRCEYMHACIHTCLCVAWRACAHNTFTLVTWAEPRAADALSPELQGREIWYNRKSNYPCPERDAHVRDKSKDQAADAKTIIITQLLRARNQAMYTHSQACMYRYTHACSDLA